MRAALLERQRSVTEREALAEVISLLPAVQWGTERSTLSEISNRNPGRPAANCSVSAGALLALEAELPPP